MLINNRGGLTDHQKEKHDEILKYLENTDKVILSGSAGVGKTFTANELVKSLLNRCRGTIICSAPTNKAVSVLQSKVNVGSNRVRFESTHKALKMQRHICDETGAISFKPAYNERYPPLLGVDYIVVDEASMVNQEMLDYLDEHSLRQGCKILFILDGKQLPPVTDRKERVIRVSIPVLSQGYPNVELLEIIRQGNGNPIIDLSMNLSWVYGGQSNYIKDTKTGYLFSNEYDKVLNKLAESNGTDFYKYLAYTNESVNAMNSIVRTKIYGDNPKRLQIGETMILDAPYGLELKTNQEVKIEGIQHCEENFVYHKDKESVLHFYLTNVMWKDPITKFSKRDRIMVLKEDSDIEFAKIRKYLRDLAKKGQYSWKDFYTFVEQFAQLKYNHALSIHKSQGSTYQNVIINVKDCKRCFGEERRHLLYTAITRASNLVVLYNT